MIASTRIKKRSALLTAFISLALISAVASFTSPHSSRACIPARQELVFHYASRATSSSYAIVKNKCLASGLSRNRNDFALRLKFFVNQVKVSIAERSKQILTIKAIQLSGFLKPRPTHNTDIGQAPADALRQ